MNATGATLGATDSTGSRCCSPPPTAHHRWSALQGRQGGALGNMRVLGRRGGTQPVLRAPAAVPPADEDGGGGGLHQLSTRKRFFPHGAPARAKTL